MSLFKRRKKIADEVENTTEQATEETTADTEQATEETTADTEQEQPAGVVTIQQLNEFFDKQGFSSALAKNNLNAATYYACMLIRCNALAKVPFKVYERDGDGAKEAKHHLNKLLKLRPNRFMTAHDFLWASEFQRLSTGNTFWVYLFRRGKIEEIYLLDSNYVEIISIKLGSVRGSLIRQTVLSQTIVPANSAEAAITADNARLQAELDDMNTRLISSSISGMETYTIDEIEKYTINELEGK